MDKVRGILLKKNYKKDYVGQKFGKLTVIAVTDKRNKSGRIICRCRCECGKEKETPFSYLKAGVVKSCGCLAMRNLTGRIFGRLQAITPTEKRNISCDVIWECKCECGREVEVPSTNLIHGKTKSCGCLLVEKDVTGKMFGKLQAIALTEKRSSSGQVIWHCKCECGSETEVSLGDLISGNIISCGCSAVLDSTMKKKATALSKSTGIRNIFYTKSGEFEVGISREGNQYRQIFRTLTEALDAKEQILEKYKRKDLNWHDKL